MSENEEKLKKPRRKRRQFTPEFKAGAVKLVLAEGKSSTEAAGSGIGSQNVSPAPLSQRESA